MPHDVPHHLGVISSSSTGKRRSWFFSCRYEAGRHATALNRVQAHLFGPLSDNRRWDAGSSEANGGAGAHRRSVEADTELGALESGVRLLQLASRDEVRETANVAATLEPSGGREMRVSTRAMPWPTTDFGPSPCRSWYVNSRLASVLQCAAVWSAERQAAAQGGDRAHQS